MIKKTCTNKNQCCDEDRCYCGENETIVLEHEEMKMIAQMARLAIRTVADHPGRWRTFGSDKTVVEKMKALIEKVRI